VILDLAQYAPELPEGGDLADILESPNWCGLPITESAAPGDLGQWLLEQAAKLPEAESQKRTALNFDFQPVVVSLASVQPEPIRWLWRNRISLGRITLLAGPPGQGKSFLSMDFAARVTTGTPWPDGEPCEKGSVLVLSLEDDPADTIRPRLDAHYADTSKVFLLRGVEFTETNGTRGERAITLGDVGTLELALSQQPDCRLVIIDPVGDFLGARTDSHRDNEVRAVLSPLCELARKHNVAILIIAHWRKSRGDGADEMVIGSRGFTGIARAVWHVARDPDDRGRRLFLPGKQNLGPETSGLAFRITGEPPRVVWERGPVTMTADDVIEATVTKRGPEAKVELEAKTFLLSALMNGPRHAKELIKKWKEAFGGSPRTLYRAKGELDIEAFRTTNPGPWFWRLPNQKGGMGNGNTLPESTLPTQGGRLPTQKTWQSGQCGLKTTLFDGDEGQIAKFATF
jgi:hypothetical protein